VPVQGQGARPEAEPWPTDEHAIRIDEMFARQLDTEFASDVRGLSDLPLDPAGIAANSRAFPTRPNFQTRECRETADEKPWRPRV